MSGHFWRNTHVGNKKYDETTDGLGQYRYNRQSSLEDVHGFNIPIEPKEFIEEIYINSKDPWLKPIVEALLKKDGLKIEVSISQIT